MGLICYELVAAKAAGRLPERVAAALREMGLACNDLVIAISHAAAHEKAAIAMEEAVKSAADPSTWRLELAAELSMSALSYRDQLISVYAQAAATYAVYASEVLADLIALREPAAPPSAATAPSQVIQQPATALNRARLQSSTPPGGDPNDPDDQLNARFHDLLQETHRHLRSAAADEYDDRARAGARRRGAVDMAEAMPEALHAYAAAAVASMARLQPEVLRRDG